MLTKWYCPHKEFNRSTINEQIWKVHKILVILFLKDAHIDTNISFVSVYYGVYCAKFYIWSFIAFNFTDWHCIIYSIDSETTWKDYSRIFEFMRIRRSLSFVISIMTNFLETGQMSGRYGKTIPKKKSIDFKRELIETVDSSDNKTSIWKSYPQNLFRLKNLEATKNNFRHFLYWKGINRVL